MVTQGTQTSACPEWHERGEPLTSRGRQSTYRPAAKSGSRLCSASLQRGLRRSNTTSTPATHTNAAKTKSKTLVRPMAT